MTPKTLPIKEKIDQSEFMKSKCFCSAKDAVKRIKIQAIYWDKRTLKAQQ